MSYLVLQAQVKQEGLHTYVTNMFVPGKSAFNTSHIYIQYYTHEEPPFISFFKVFPFLIMISLYCHYHIWCCRFRPDWRPFSPWLTRLSQDQAGLEAFSHHNWHICPRIRPDWRLSHHNWHVCPRIRPDWRPFSPPRQVCPRLTPYRRPFSPPQKVCPRPTPDWRPFSPQRTYLSKAHTGLEAFLTTTDKFVPGSCLFGGHPH